MTSEVTEGRALLPRQLVTTRHDQHSIRREQRLEPQTVRQRLPRPNREVQLASRVLKTAGLRRGRCGWGSGDQPSRMTASRLNVSAMYSRDGRCSCGICSITFATADEVACPQSRRRSEAE